MIFRFSFAATMNSQFSSNKFRLGVLGGGQLGRMLIQEAINLNISISVMDPDANAPCRHLVDSFTHADFRDKEAVLAFAKDLDVLTVEIEHVNTEALVELQASGVKVFPQPEVLAMVQDKGLQKEFYKSHNIPTAPFVLNENRETLLSKSLKYPFIFKMRKGGYDGKGVMKINSVDELKEAFDGPSVIEEMIDFKQEIGVLVARNEKGEISSFPAVDMEFNPQVNLVEFLCSPARISMELELEAIRIAKDVIAATNMVGLLAVEMFVTKDNKILVNEIAPRPHNSGHQTIEGNITSQYAQHLRAILNLPLGDTSIVKPSVMINLLGEEGYSGDASYIGIEEVLAMKGVYIHLYGKKITKPFRKMGHVTVTADKLENAIQIARKVQSIIKIISTNN